MDTAGRVLIIDDDDVVRSMEVLALEKAGWEVAESSSGAAGVTRAKEFMPDVVICDRRMPDLDGLGVVAALASDPATAWIPVVMVSACNDADDIVVGIDAGAHDYLVKPFNPAELAARCRAALRASRDHQRLAETTARLAESEAAYRRIVEVAAEGIWVVDADNRVTYANRRMADMLGVTVDELIGRRPVEFAAPGWDVIADERTERRRAGIAETVDFEFVRADGTNLWVSINSAPMFDDDGTYAGSMGMVSDVTVRREQEAALARSDARYQALLEHQPDTVAIVYDSSLTARVAAGAGFVARGQSAPDLVGRHVSDLASPADLETLVPLYAAAFQGRASSVEFHSHLTGYDNLLDVVPVSSGGAQPEEILVVARNLGPIRERERALAAAEERWRVAFEAAPVGVALMDTDGRLVAANQALADLLGSTAEALDGADVTRFCDAEDRVRVRNALRRLADEEVFRLSGEQRFLREDGSAICVHASVVSLRNANDEVELLVHFVDVTARKVLEEELRHDARHDPLTGLLNRRGFEDELERHHLTTVRYGDRGAVVVMDIDGLKAVNDNFGHAAGDALLAEVGETLRKRLRATDVVGRLGGDEFAAILPRVEAAQACAVAQALVDAIGALRIGGSPTATVGASIGVALFGPGAPIRDVLAGADRTMYGAKAAGGRRYAMAYELARVAGA